MALRTEQILVDGFDSNFSYLIYCDVTQEACIIDPTGNFQLVVDKIAQLQVNVVAIMLTHTHQDHTEALAAALELFAVPVFVHELGAPELVADLLQPLVDGDEIELGEGMIAVAHTPGHSIDSVGYLFTTVDQQLVLIAGDTLFIDGCGRTDELGVADLYNSLQFIKSLPASTLILPGHNYGPAPVDSLANQLLTNRFLRAETFADFCIERLGYTVVT